MPCSIKLRLHQARGLDCERDEDGKYVEVSFHDHVKMSERSTGYPGNPVWGDSVMSIELTDDFQLQDYPLRLGVCSSDTGPPDHGFVTINLEQILHSKGEQDPDATVGMKGWFPLFDTMTGVRGHLLVSIKMQFVGDQSYNDRFASSVGVRFFSIATPPQPGVFVVEQLVGLVEELRVVQDPEYHWRDLIRSDRSSNEERLRVFHNAAMRARRELGKQVRRVGANAVLGYREYVDLEGDATDKICIRAFGTAARIVPTAVAERGLGLVRQGSFDTTRSPKMLGAESRQIPALQLPPTVGIGEAAAQGSDEGAAASIVDSPSCAVLQRGVLHSLDRLPVSRNVAICGVVAARAVKVFNSRTTQETREAWWADLREELLSHARALGGDTIVGYREHVSITDEVAMLSAMGTALRHPQSSAAVGGLPDCSLVHTEQESRDDVARLARCRMCGEGMVPNVLLATVDFPEGLPTMGRSELVEARVCRLKRKLSGEAHAQDLSEALPFLELELHKQLLHKMRVMGLNAAFGLRVEISHGPSLLIGVATATAMLVPALPSPPIVRAQLDRFAKSRDLSEASSSAHTARGLSQAHATSRGAPVSPGTSGVVRRSQGNSLGARLRAGGPQDTAAASAPPAGSGLGFTPTPGANGGGGSSSSGSGAAGSSSQIREGNKESWSVFAALRASCRHRLPGRLVRRWLPRMGCGFLSLTPVPVSGGDLARNRPSLLESSHGRRRPTEEALRRLNFAVACHLQRRGDSSSPEPSIADSFDWPVDKLQALCASRSSPQLPVRQRSGSVPSDPTEVDSFVPNFTRKNSPHFGPADPGNESQQRRQEDRPIFVFEVDDEADEDLLMVLDDPLVPEKAVLCTVDCPPDGTKMFKGGGSPDEDEDITQETSTCSVVYGVRRVDLFDDLGLDRADCTAGGAGSVQVTAMLTHRLAKVLNEMYACLLFREMVRRQEKSSSGLPAAPFCCLAALSWRIAVLEDDVIELVLTGQLLAATEQPALAGAEPPVAAAQGPGISAPSAGLRQEAARDARQHTAEVLARRHCTQSLLWHTLHLGQGRPWQALQPLRSRQGTAEARNTETLTAEGRHNCKELDELSFRGPAYSMQEAQSSVLVSALSSVPHWEVERYCGLVTVHMIKETVNVTRQFESLQVFYRQFVAEALLTAKAHVLAVGGDALLGYRINNLFLREDKRRAYAVISISGDAAKLRRDY